MQEVPEDVVAVGVDLDVVVGHEDMAGVGGIVFGDEEAARTEVLEAEDVEVEPTLRSIGHCLVDSMLVDVEVVQ